MRKLILISALFFGILSSAQDVHFTIYNFSVENENVATVFNLFDDYFSKNKPDGVTVALYENHFNDSGNNFSHSVVFSGSLDAMGAMYSGGNDDSWNLFLTQVNQQMEEGFSSAMGRQLSAFGDSSQQHPFQRYYLLDVENVSKYVDAFNAYNKDHNPDGRLTAMGNISVGHGPDGINVWVINSFKDFKTAMAGVGSLRTEAQKEASSKAWDERRANAGEVEMVRSGLRILLKSW